MSKRGHVPVRICIGCRNRRKKEEMIRLVETADGLVRANEKNGSARGFYLCRDSECLRKAKKRHRMGPVAGMDEAGDIDRQSAQ